MQASAFNPSASFTPSTQGVSSNMSMTATPFASNASSPHAFQASPWTPTQLDRVCNQSQQQSFDQEPNCKFAGSMTNSDLNCAKSASCGTSTQASSGPSSPTRFASASQQAPPTTLQNAFFAQANPFVPTVSEFVPSIKTSAPSFVPSAASFQPSSFPQSFAPNNQQPMGAFYGQNSYGEQSMAYQPYPYGMQSVPIMMPCDADGKYKTELCKNWIETAKCRYEDKCRFAHGQEELTQAAVCNYNVLFKSKNCRTFYHTKQCMYGERCMFRHEHRSFKQLHRHYYTPVLFQFETLYATAPDKKTFIEAFNTQSERLPVFKNIHNAFSSKQAEKEWGLITTTEESTGSEVDLSESEFPELTQIHSLAKQIEESPMTLSKSGSSLNTTVDSDQIPQKVALFACSSPARINSDSEQETASDSEDISMSPRSLGLDFVVV